MSDSPVVRLSIAGRAIVRKQSVKGRIKVKTGCATCRIRKIKCDEKKPFCRRCITTGRACDGYDSPFRVLTSQPVKNAYGGGAKSRVALHPVWPNSGEIDGQDVDLLNRSFSTKTIFDVKLGCGEEARQVLQASLSSPPIRHAISSLRALREDFETLEVGPLSNVQQSASYTYGLQQYSIALTGLASNLSSPSSNGIKSALFCCQVFISIEQVQGNYAAMIQHMIRGLKIMHEYRARPSFVAVNNLAPARHDQLPLLDIFIIKLFAAPCKFTERPATAQPSGTTLSPSSTSKHQQSAGSHDLRTIAPNMRTELTRIATSTLEFLDQVAQVESPLSALRLLSDKTIILESLESWLIDLELVQTESGFLGYEPLSVSFLRLFHLILRSILLGALDSSPDVMVKLQTEHDRLQSVADALDSRVKAYMTCNRIRGRGIS